MSENQDIENVVKHLNDNNIPYVVVGGVPTILYGVERATFDLEQGKKYYE